MNPHAQALPVTRRVVAAAAILLLLAQLAFVGSAGGAWSRAAYVVLALLACFPFDRVAALWRWLTDRRPAPDHFGTGAALDPREGHAETEDLHLVGRILERRRLE
jgi:hypothetical protein